MRNLAFVSISLALAAFAADSSRELGYLTMDDCGLRQRLHVQG